MPTEFIAMEKDGTHARASRKAYDLVWAPLGWSEVGPLAAEALAVTGEEVTAIEQLKKDQLVELAESRGLKVDGFTRSDIISSINNQEA